VGHWLEGIVEQKVGGIVEQKVGRVVEQKVGPLFEAVERLADRDAQRHRQVMNDMEGLEEGFQQLRKGKWRADNNLPPFVEDPARPRALPLGAGKIDGQ
jgi:hypothetical protein